MYILNSIGFNLVIFSITENTIIKIISILYLIISILVQLYIIGDEKQKRIN